MAWNWSRWPWRHPEAEEVRELLDEVEALVAEGRKQLDRIEALDRRPRTPLRLVEPLITKADREWARKIAEQIAPELKRRVAEKQDAPAVGMTHEDMDRLLDAAMRDVKRDATDEK